MVKQQKKNNMKKRAGKEFKGNRTSARKINASTGFDTCTEQLSPFGGLLGLIKFLEKGAGLLLTLVLFCLKVVLCPDH